MPEVFVDKAGHEMPLQELAVAQLTAGAVGTSVAGTISPTVSAGQTPTVTIGRCDDRHGHFLLNPITGGGAQAAGQVVLVRFASAYTLKPVVVLTITDETDTTVPAFAAANLVTENGFDILVSAALTTAKAYRIHYHVIE